MFSFVLAGCCFVLPSAFSRFAFRVPRFAFCVSRFAFRVPHFAPPVFGAVSVRCSLLAYPCSCCCDYLLVLQSPCARSLAVVVATMGGVYRASLTIDGPRAVVITLGFVFPWCVRSPLRGHKFVLAGFFRFHLQTHPPGSAIHWSFPSLRLHHHRPILSSIRSASPASSSIFFPPFIRSIPFVVRSSSSTSSGSITYRPVLLCRRQSACLVTKSDRRRRQGRRWLMARCSNTSLNISASRCFVH